MHGLSVFAVFPLVYKFMTICSTVFGPRYAKAVFGACPNTKDAQPLTLSRMMYRGKNKTLNLTMSKRQCRINVAPMYTACVCKNVA